MAILVVGSVALDTVKTPFGQVEDVLGGAVSFFSLAASLYVVYLLEIVKLANPRIRRREAEERERKTA